MVNPVAAGFLAGGILARNSGPRAAVGGGMAFAAFSAAIDLFLRRETPEYVTSILPLYLGSLTVGSGRIRRFSCRDRLHYVNRTNAALALYNANAFLIPVRPVPAISPG
jgi:hypothetical protein